MQKYDLRNEENLLFYYILACICQKLTRNKKQMIE